MNELDDWRSFEARMGRLEDKALQELVAVRHEQYTPPALHAARMELQRRKVAVLGAQEYWNTYPGERIGLDGFCQDCREETTDEPLGDILSIYGIGTRLLGGSQGCMTCGSSIRSKWFCFLLPVRREGRYRVIILGDGMPPIDCIGRKMKE